MKTILTFLITFCFVGLSLGQTVWDFRSVGDGNWSDGSKWQVWYDLGRGGDWYAFGLAPDNYVGVLNTISVYNHITVASGLVTMPSDLIIFSGASLTISNSGTVEVTGTLTNNAGTSGLVIEATSDAEVAGSLIYNGTGLSGTFEQSVSKDVWHLLGIPVSSATLGDFNPASGDGYMRSYIDGTGWDVYLTNESDVLSVGEGYEYWTTVNNTVSVTGTFNTGTQSNTLLSTGNKYNLITNPYPCSIDWTSVSDRTNVDGSTMYLYANTAGTEGYYAVNGSGISVPSGANKYIPPFQAFFVEQSSGSTMNFTNANKAHGDKAFYKQSDEINYSDLLRLHVEEIVNEETMYSEMVVLQDENASNDYDVLYDTKRLGSGSSSLVAPSIYALVGDENIIINSISTYPTVVPVEIEIVDAGSITLTISEFSEMQDYTNITLEDRETDEFYDLDQNFSGISFDVEPGMVSDRFFVHYSTTVGLEEQDLEDASIYSNKNIIYIDNGNSEDFDVQVINMMGQTIYEGNKSGSGLTTVSLDQPAAYYVVRLISEEHTITKKMYIAK